MNDNSGKPDNFTSLKDLTAKLGENTNSIVAAASVLNADKVTELHLQQNEIISDIELTVTKIKKQ